MISPIYRRKIGYTTLYYKFLHSALSIIVKGEVCFLQQNAEKNAARGPLVLAAGAVVQLLTGIPAAWGVFQRPIMEQFAFTRGQATLAFAVLVASYGIGCALGGLLQDQKGPRPAALLGTGLLAAGFLLGAVVPNGNAPLFLLVYSVPAGLGSAFVAPAVLACAQKWYATKKGWATGVTGVAMGLSGAFFTLVVRLVGGAWGMRVCLAVLGGLVLLLCGAGAAVLQDPPFLPQPASGKGRDIPPRQMLRTPQYKLCVAAVALSAPPVLLFSPDILQFAADRGLPEEAAPWCIVLGSAASAVGRLSCPALSDRWGRKPVLYGIYAGLAVGSVGLAFAQGWLVLAAYAVLTLCYSGCAAVQPSFNSDLFGLKHAGINYGFLALGMSAGSLLSYTGNRLLPEGLRHIAAGVCAVAGGLCVAVVKMPEAVEKPRRAR